MYDYWGGLFEIWEYPVLLSLLCGNFQRVLTFLLPDDTFWPFDEENDFVKLHFDGNESLELLLKKKFKK